MNMLRVERFLDYVLTGGEHTDTTNNQNNNSDHNPTLGEGGETTSSGSGAPETSSMPTQTTPAPKSSFSSFSSSPLKRTIKQLEEEIEELRSVVADKDALLSAKVAELNSYRTKVELWKEKVKGMVTKDKERIDFLQRENDTLKALIQKTGSSNQSTSDEVLTKLKSFETKETEQTNEIVTLRSTIAEFDNKFDTLLRNHAAQISELQTTNTELCKENNYLRKVVAADGVAGQVMELQQHIASLEEHAKLKQDIATKLMVDINQQNQRIKELEDEVRETSKAVESLSAEVARCGEEKERLMGDVAEGQHVIAHLQSELQSAHNLYDDLVCSSGPMGNSSNAVSASEGKRLKAECERLRSQYDTACQRMLELKEHIHVLEDHSKVKQEAAVRLMMEVDEWKSKCEQMEKSK